MIKNKKVIIITLVLLLTIVVYSSFRNKNKTNLSNPTTQTIQPIPTPIPKYQECPDAWYMVGTPIIVDNPEDAKYAGQYFMVNNQRRELPEYDVEWIKQNCPVNKPELIE